ncbi:Aste57867_4380 [Aphanomyces stellatus]|uniref:Aste57867_4380 protein n=1 Tax=Aphanomyces stellatus TaxID=120398 RepID=A0A485KGQ7_9STRA|nr:hypothetical protein As57867_004368 [Aphanomyces stellatus]VFT81494.1 Aste57867_4380 [Aphanomyces stellatus]
MIGHSLVKWPNQRAAASHSRMHPRGHVLAQPDVLRVIASFQDGLDRSMKPLADMELPTLHTRTCRWESGDVVARDRLTAGTMSAFHAAFSSWLSDHGMFSLPRLFACLPRLVEAVVRDAIWFNDLPLLRWLQVNVTTLAGSLVDVAAMNNQLEMVVVLTESGHDGCSSDAMDWACEHGNLNMLQFLHAHKRPLCTGYGLYEAVAKGHVAVVEYILDHRLVEDWESYLHADTAAGTGRMDFVQRLLDLGAQLSSEALIPAATHGHLEMVECLYATHHDPHHVLVAAVHAAKNGHATVVSFLLQAISEMDPVYRKVCHAAAAAGHLDIVQLVHPLVGDMDSTLDLAVGNGHLQLVQWLSQTQPMASCSQSALDLAAANNHLDVIRWLQTRQRVEFTSKAMDGAAQNGHLEMLEWLHGHCIAGYTSDAMAAAVNNGHLDVVQWIHAKHTQRASEGDAAFSILGLVRWFLGNPTERPLLTLAARAGHIKLVKWLLANISVGCPRCARIAAEEHQHAVTAIVLRRTPRNKSRECAECMRLADSAFYIHDDYFSSCSRCGRRRV